MRSLIRLVAVVAALLTALATLTSAGAETKSYALKSPYVKRVGFANNTGAVVVKLRIKKLAKTVRVQGWSLGLDTDPTSRPFRQAAEFGVAGDWKRPKRTYLYVNDPQTQDSSVSCPGLKVKVTHAGRGRTVRIPRSCLFYAPTSTEAAATRFQAVVYGDRKTKSGYTCWGVSAPKKGWTPWLAVGDGATRALPSPVEDASARRGC